MAIILSGLLAKEPAHMFDRTKQGTSGVSLFLKAMLGPIVVIALLALRSIAGISVRPVSLLPPGWFSDDCCNRSCEKHG